jgi:PGF-CTERM protein
LYMDNPSLNDVELTVDARVSVPSGLHVSSEGYAWAAAAGTAYAYFTVPPGTVRTISMYIQADKSARIGSHTLHFSGLYYPGENKDLYNPISLTYPIEVKEASKEIITATPAPTETPAQRPVIPGFEAIFAIAGLLAVAYLVGRKK